jgi:hypothetical protein
MIMMVLLMMILTVDSGISYKEVLFRIITWVY